MTIAITKFFDYYLIIVRLLLKVVRSIFCDTFLLKRKIEKLFRWRFLLKTFSSSSNYWQKSIIGLFNNNKLRINSPRYLNHYQLFTLPIEFCSSSPRIIVLDDFPSLLRFFTFYKTKNIMTFAQIFKHIEHQAICFEDFSSSALWKISWSTCTNNIVVSNLKRLKFQTKDIHLLKLLVVWNLQISACMAEQK